MPASLTRLAWSLVVFAILSAGCSSSTDQPGNVSPSSTAGVSTTVDSATTTSAEASVSTTESTPAVETDYGVSDSTIRIGYSLDLSGPFRRHDGVVRDVHEAYFAAVNDSGGIDGRQVELVVLDNSFDVPLHLDNVAQLVEQSADGVLVLGDISHPLFGDATVSALGDVGILAVSMLEPAEETAGSTVVSAVAGSICRETEVALQAIAAQADGEPRRIAIIGRNEPWSEQSMEAARSISQELGFDVVMSVVGVEDVEDVVAQLLATESDVVWLAVTPRELVLVSSVLGALEREWVWAGTSLTFDNSVLASEAASELAKVYVHVSGTQPGIGTNDAAILRQEISGLLPEMTLGDGDAAFGAWAQAERIHDALLRAFERNDMTRSGVASAARSLLIDSSIGLYQIDPRPATLDVPLGTADAVTGLMPAENVSSLAATSSSCP